MDAFALHVSRLQGSFDVAVPGSSAALADLENVAASSNLLKLRISVASPPHVDSSSSWAVMYVLDSEPSFFAIAAAHAFAQAMPGYGSWARAKAPANLAVVGIGIHPQMFDLNENGWDVKKLRIIRRRAFAPHADEEENKVQKAVVDTIANVIVPEAERRLGVQASDTAHVKRCILGASFTALTALQSLFCHPQVFGYVVAGSPSPYSSRHPSRTLDPEGPDLVPVTETDPFAIEKRAAASDGGYARAQAVLLTVGGLEHARMHASAQAWARTLRERGLTQVHERVLAGESHTSCKPVVISQAFNWWQEQLTHNPVDWR